MMKTCGVVIYIFTLIIAFFLCGNSAFAITDNQTIADSMVAAGNCLLNQCDPNKDYMPLGGWMVTHDTGRWWDAVLRLENVSDFVIPPQIEAGMLKNLDYFTANPDGFLFIPPGYKGGLPNPELHSMREALLAFTALVKYRNSNWARGKAQKILETVDRNLDKDGRVIVGNLKYHAFAGLKKEEKNNQVIAPAGEENKKDGIAQNPSVLIDNTASTGRFLEAVVIYATETNDPLAIQVAGKTAEPIFRQIFTSDLRLRPEFISGERVGHTHSLMGTLKGLYLYGELVKDSKYACAVSNVCKHDLPGKVILPSGLATHDLGGITFKNNYGEPVGDMASSADYAQLTFWIGSRGGYAEYLDETEKIVRSRLLPSQCSENDANRFDPQLRKKATGGWGIHALPHASKGATIDVVAETLHCLTDIYKNMVVRQSSGVWIYLTFDHESNLASIKVNDSETRSILIIPKVNANLFVRIPGWAGKESLQVKVDGKNYNAVKLGNYILFQNKDIQPGTEIRITFDLPKIVTQEVMKGSGRKFTFTWKGDRIESVCPNEPEQALPYYKTSPDCPENTTGN